MPQCKLLIVKDNMYLEHLDKTDVITEGANLSPVLVWG